METCIYCQGVYELNESNSSNPTCCCSIECEEGMKEHIKAVDEFFKKE